MCCAIYFNFSDLSKVRELVSAGLHSLPSPGAALSIIPFHHMLWSRLFPIGQITKFICLRLTAVSFEALHKARRFSQKCFIKFLFWGRDKYISDTRSFLKRMKRKKQTQYLSRHLDSLRKKKKEKSSRSKDSMRCQHNQHINNSTIIGRCEFTGCHPKRKRSQTKGPVTWSICHSGLHRCSPLLGVLCKVYLPSCSPNHVEIKQRMEKKFGCCHRACHADLSTWNIV